MGHWVRLLGTQAHQSLATLRSGMGNSEVEEEGRCWEELPGFPPHCQDLQKKDKTILVDLGLRPKIAARLLGKAIFLLLGFCPVGLVPVSDVKLKGKWGQNFEVLEKRGQELEPETV